MAIDVLDVQDDVVASGRAERSTRPLDRARLLSRHLFDQASVADADAVFPRASFEALERSGLALAVFPEILGGAGLLEATKSRELARILRLVGAGDLSIGRLFEGHVNAVGLLVRYGTASQLAGLADAVRQGRLSAVWNAEGRRPLLAEAVGTAWVLQGEKILASGAGIITRPIVTPQTPDGVLMTILDLDHDGPSADLSSWTPQGMRATATGTIDFTGTVVPRNAVIGRPGDYPRQPLFSGGAWRFCAVHLGAAERLMDLFRQHLVSRGRHQDPYQKQRIATGVAAITTAAFWVERAAGLSAAETLDAAEIVAFVNLTRMATERACLDVLELVHRGVGLASFMRPDPIERISRDLATYLRQPVPDAAMADAAGFVLGSETAMLDLWEV